jgi:hypothetical protein
MTLEQSIIEDLQFGQSTADALALRMGKRRDTVEIILRRLEAQKLIFSSKICNDKFTVWRFIQKNAR